MKILGLDICKDRAVGWLLEEMPPDPKSYWVRESKGRSKNPLEDSCTFYFDRKGIERLIALAPDAIALEPTGMRYSALVAKVADHHGIKIFWVGHAQAHNYRKQIKLPDKNDLADSLALACYTTLYHPYPQYFLRFEAGKIADLRETYLQIKSLQKFQVSMILRLKIQLALEFPEAMDVELSPQRDGRRALACFLAGRTRDLLRSSSYWKKRYATSIAHDYDIELSGFTCFLARQIDDYDAEILRLEQVLRALVYDPIFEKYNRVFSKFDFDLKTRAILLVQVYPFKERFVSLPPFKRRLGCAKVERSSGSSKSWVTGDGSVLSRTQLYLWASHHITQGRKKADDSKEKASHRIDGTVLAKVYTYYDSWQEKFYSNPSQWGKAIADRAKAAMISKFKSFLDSELGAILNLPELARVKGNLEALESLIGSQELEVSSKKVSKKMGNLLLNKTIGYAVRWLYRELEREFK